MYAHCEKNVVIHANSVGRYKKQQTVFVIIATFYQDSNLIFDSEKKPKVFAKTGEIFITVLCIIILKCIIVAVKCP